MKREYFSERTLRSLKWGGDVSGFNTQRVSKGGLEEQLLRPSVFQIPKPSFPFVAPTIYYLSRIVVRALTFSKVAFPAVRPPQIGSTALFSLIV